jgi:hypothetical protein
LRATFATPMTSWSFLKVHVENAPPPGEAAMIISAAQHALPPEVFVEFARENAHWYTPETLHTIFRCGYWPLGATRAVVATIEELLPKGGRVAYCGACDGSGIEFGRTYQVELYDPVPMGPRVARGFYPSDEVDAIGISCALAPPAWLPEQLTGLLTKVRADHGVLVIGDYRGRGHAMETAAMLLACLAESGAGTVERRACAGYHRKYEVDLLIFTRRPGQGIRLLPTTALAPREIALFKAVPKPPSPAELPSMPTDPRSHEPFVRVDLYSKTSLYDDGIPGVYAIARLGDGGAAGAAAGTASAPPSTPYMGASGDACKRCFDHIVRLPEKGTNRALRAFFAPFHPHERAARAGVALVFGLGEADPTFLDALAGGKRKTADQAQMMLHILEQRALGGELSNLVNATDGAFGHGVFANAAPNSAPRHRS